MDPTEISLRDEADQEESLQEPGFDEPPPADSDEFLRRWYLIDEDDGPTPAPENS